QWTCEDLRNQIDYLIDNIDIFAKTIEKGLIR
ncbi:unnamed protein product, partial [marine sediment metagenome]